MPNLTLQRRRAIILFGIAVVTFLVAFTIITLRDKPMVKMRSGQEQDLYSKAALSYLPSELVCARFPKPVVGVVITGSVRSFIQPLVFRSIENNIINAFGGNAVVFFNLNLLEVSNNEMRAWIGERVHYLAKRFKAVHVADLDSAPIPYKPNYNCVFKPGVPMDWHDCEVNPDNCNANIAFRQYGQLERVWGKIQDYERENDIRFTYLMRVRSDVFIPQSLPPFCFFDAKRNAIYHSNWDFFNLMSRDAAHVLFGLLPRLKACNRTRQDVFNIESILALDAVELGSEMIPLSPNILNTIMARPPRDIVDTKGRPVLVENCEVNAMVTTLGSTRRCFEIMYKNPTNIMDAHHEYDDAKVLLQKLQDD